MMQLASSREHSAPKLLLLIGSDSQFCRWRAPSGRAESVADAGADPTVATRAIQIPPGSVCYEALSLIDAVVVPGKTL